MAIEIPVQRVEEVVDEVLGGFDVQMDPHGRHAQGVRVIWLLPEQPATAAFNARLVRYVIVYAWRHSRTAYRVLFAKDDAELERIVAYLRSRDDQRARIYVFALRPMYKWIRLHPRGAGGRAKWIKKPITD